MTIYRIPGKPTPWMRSGRRKNRYYDKQMETKASIRTIVQSQMEIKKPISSPLKLTVEFHLPIPISYSKAVRWRMLKTPHKSIPDLDNMIKFLCDALNKVLWVDDSLIYEIHSRKIYTEKTMTKTLFKVEPYKKQLLPTILEKYYPIVRKDPTRTKDCPPDGRQYYNLEEKVSGEE